jgi:PD-(D/E)XK nuclease superfamily protein
MTVDVNWYIDKRLVHEFHTSERKSFRGCRRRWDWLFRDNYYPKVTAKPLDFGTAYHKALEVYYDPSTWNLPREVVVESAIRAFINKNNVQRKEAHDSLQFKTEEEVDADFDERIVLATGMLRHLVSTIGPKEDLTWDPVRVEIPFMVPIPHPDTNEPMSCRCDACYAKATTWWLANNDHWPDGGWKGLPVVYAGRIDCLGKDGYEDLWLIDWKTAIRIPDNHEFLVMDDQIGSYCWALWSIGMNVAGFIYHEQKKGFPQPPKKNKNIRLGRMYSVAADQDTDYETYLKTVQEGDPGAYEKGLYDTMLNMLQEHGMQFYYRETVHKTEEELINLGRDLGNEVLDMLAPDLRIYPNASRFGCSNCAFSQPCTEKNRGGDYLYGLETMFEKREAYYLREEASTDKKTQQ